MDDGFVLHRQRANVGVGYYVGPVPYGLQETRQHLRVPIRRTDGRYMGYCEPFLYLLDCFRAGERWGQYPRPDRQPEEPGQDRPRYPHRLVTSQQFCPP